MAVGAIILGPMLLALLLACAGGDDTGSPDALPEPLDLPEDPAAPGVPVGVRTEVYEGVTLEVWYPASDAAADDATEYPDFMAFVPEVFLETVGTFAFPPVDSGAVRDAPLRIPAGDPYPMVLFSHGFGGMRLQSLDYAVHLASRGYVVVAADHPGRMMGDILPCMFSPALEGCDLSGFGGADPAADDIPLAADWVEAQAVSGWLAGAIDPARMALSGHSAGAGTTIGVGETDPRFVALLPLAGGGATERDVPHLIMGGTCDGFAEDASLVAAWESAADARLVRILGAGHLAFSDLCELDLLGLGQTLLEGRDDVNETMLELLYQLASDGCAEGVPTVDDPACADGYLPLSTSDPIVRHYATVYFDAELKGEGEGVTAGVYPDADVR